MDIMQVAGIIAAIIFIVWGSVKGFNIMVIAPIAASLVILTNQMAFSSSLIGHEASFMTGLTNFITNFFPVFLLGSILANYIDKSGAAQSIAQKIVGITGTEKPLPVLLALYFITILLTYGGVSVFVVVFVLIPLAKPLFKEMDIAWNLVGIPIQLGAATITMTMLPGTPSIQNVVPTAYLGTTLTAAPIIGIVASIVAMVFGVWYMGYTLRKSLKNKENFATYQVEGSNLELRTDIPSITRSLTPILLLIVINVIGSAMAVDHIILISLFIAIVASGLLFKNYLPSQLNVLNSGATGSIMPVFLTASAVAFGVVITLAPGFDFISDLILGMPGNPLVSLSTAAALFGGITGSASGALGIVMEAFSENYLALGIHPEVIHRISAIASAGLTVVPHSGAILTFFAIAGLSHKNSFKNIFIAVTGANLLALIAAIVTATIIY